MRGAAFLVSACVLGCATAGRTTPPAAAPAAPPALTKDEIAVYGLGPEPMPGMKPQDEGTEFVVVDRHTLRCTRTKHTALNPTGMVNCRDITRGESRDPDPGRVIRAQTQPGAK